MADESAILALDQGTTSSRAILFKSDLSVLGAAQREFAQHYPASGWVEHEPEDIWRTTVETARQALSGADFSAGKIAAIGITNQRETCLLWDRAHQPADPSRHRLAGPAHRRDLRRPAAAGPRAGDHRAHGSPARSVFFRHQDCLAARSCGRRACAGRGRPSCFWHGRQFSAVASDRRQGARNRCDQRLAHAAVTISAKAPWTTICCGSSACRARSCRRCATAMPSFGSTEPRSSVPRCRSAALPATSRRR